MHADAAAKPHVAGHIARGKGRPSSATSEMDRVATQQRMYFLHGDLVEHLQPPIVQASIACFVGDGYSP